MSILFPYRPEKPLVERLRFLTDVLPGKNNTEQRIKLRHSPRQEFDFTLLVENDEREFIENLFFGAQSEEFLIPMWHEPMILTEDAAEGSSSLTVDDIECKDIRPGDSLLVLASESNYEIVTLPESSSSGPMAGTDFEDWEFHLRLFTDIQDPDIDTPIVDVTYTGIAGDTEMRDISAALAILVNAEANPFTGATDLTDVALRIADYGEGFGQYQARITITPAAAFTTAYPSFDPAILMVWDSAGFDGSDPTYIFELYYFVGFDFDPPEPQDGTTYENWVFQVQVYAPGDTPGEDTPVVDVSITGAAGNDITNITTSLRNALNATGPISASSRSAGNLVAAGVSDVLGDHQLIVTVTPSAAFLAEYPGYDPTSDPAFILSITDEGFAASSLVVDFVDPFDFDPDVAGGITNPLTIMEELTQDYPAGSEVYVIRPARILGQVKVGRYAINLTRYQITFSVTDNVVSLGSFDDWDQLDGKPILNDPNVMPNQTLEESWTRNVFVVDGLVGTFAPGSFWTRSARGSAKTFVTHDCHDLFKVRQLLYGLSGRLTSFWLPTFGHDMTAADEIDNGTTSLTLFNRGYTVYSTQRTPRNFIRVVLKTGVVYTNEITGSSELSEVNEELTVADPWPIDVALAEIERIEILEKVRLDTDDVVITHVDSVGQSQISIPVKCVFSDVVGN